MTAEEMTEALAESNDRLARTALAKGAAATTFFCECGDCFAVEVRLSLDEHEAIRVREDLIFAPGHDAQREDRSVGGGAARDMLTRSIARFAERKELAL